MKKSNFGVRTILLYFLIPIIIFLTAFYPSDKSTELANNALLNAEKSKSLPENTQLIKVQFQNREGNITKLNDLSYQSSIKTFDNESETVPTDIIITNLKPNQAKIFFKINGKEAIVIIENVKELPMLAYPSAKPKNN